MSTTLAIGRWPTASSRAFSHAGDGPTTDEEVVGEDDQGYHEKDVDQPAGDVRDGEAGRSQVREDDRVGVDELGGHRPTNVGFCFATKAAVDCR